MALEDPGADNPAPRGGMLPGADEVRASSALLEAASGCEDGSNLAELLTTGRSAEGVRAVLDALPARAMSMVGLER